MEKKVAKDNLIVSKGHSLDDILNNSDVKGSVQQDTNIIAEWFSTMELETSSWDNQKVQMEMLFSRKKIAFRPLLMSLVLQRASWQNLHSIMQYIFQDDVSDICPISALDYLTALTQSPKLWQGRDKAIPKHNHFEDVLQLNYNQLSIMVKLILEEARSQEGNKWQKKMEFRLHLLLKCIGCYSFQIVKSLMESDDEYSRELMLMIYMSLPASGKDLICQKSNISNEAYSKKCPSAVDEISHTLLSALAATPRIKDWNKKSQELELCARKLASTHPILVLRQLPMLAGSLKGRAQYDWGVLRSRGHLLLFRQVLGLMKLLEPMIFEQTETLCELLDAFFLLLQYHGHCKELSGLVNNLVTFMQNWMLKDIKVVSKYLQERGSVINDIQIVQPGVRPLLSNVSLPTSEQNSSSEFLVGTVTPRVVEPLPQTWHLLLASLQDIENLPALQELEHLTNKRPELFHHVSNSLYNFLSSPNGAVRTVAINLILKWLKFNPKASEEALPSILTCLDSDNGDVVTSILDRLSEIVSVMQEYAKIILTRVFKLGMKSTMKTTNSIQESIHLLSLQSGC
ncbi:hypothetical protein HHI36_009123 [Cryptolaemus montrouzieri]|uniref:Uncharacterized protein n=1 Tax=Cryptolaemus montrouzieri TaxID=559131 RepID=A0ABD2MV73_9CUCU